MITREEQGIRVSALVTVVRLVARLYRVTLFIDNHPMDIVELKKLLKASTSIVLIDDGKPSVVMMSYDAYRKLTADERPTEPVAPQPRNSEGSMTTAEYELLDRLNSEITALKEEIASQEKQLERHGNNV